MGSGCGSGQAVGQVVQNDLWELLAVIPDGAQLRVSTWDASRGPLSTKGVQLIEPIGDAVARVSAVITSNILTENFVVLRGPLRGVSSAKLLEEPGGSSLKEGLETLGINNSLNNLNHPLLLEEGNHVVGK